LVHGDRFFEKHGPKAVFLGRWVALLRVTAAVLAGANRMEWRKFFLWNALGGVAWAVTIGLAGFYIGHAAEQVIKTAGVWAAVVVAVIVAAVLIYIYIRERRTLKAEMSEVHRRQESGEPIAEYQLSEGETKES